MNFVQPVAKLTPTEQRLIEFKGLNKKAVVEEGEMSEMTNLTSTKYPLLTPRKPRGEMDVPSGVTEIIQIITKYDKIAMLAKVGESVKFFYDGEMTDVGELSEETRMVAINTRICFFPEKIAYHIKEGKAVSIPAALNFEPDNRYTAEYIPEDDKDVFVFVTKNGLPEAEAVPYDLSMFHKDDAVNLEVTLKFDYYENQKGKSYQSGTIYLQPQKNGNWTASQPTREKFGDGSLYYLLVEDYELTTSTSCEIKDLIMMGYEGATTPRSRMELPYNTFGEMRGYYFAQPRQIQVVSLSVERSCPNIKYVIEANNRLWGLSDDDNTIYACKLGDPTNWHYYQGTSMDSYYAEQGTDGEWTGAANYGGHLLFFKEHTITKLYGTAPASYQTQNIIAPGVEKGSSKSVTVINDLVMYKSPLGITAYDGGTPYTVADKFGDVKYKDAVGGSDGFKYYVSADFGEEGQKFLVCDIDKAIWHEEDDLKVVDTTVLDGKLILAVNEPTPHLVVVDSDEPTEGQVEWKAVFGPYDEYVENKKIYSKLSLRVSSQEEASFKVSIKVDDGEWQSVKEFDEVSVGGEFIPVIPRRCDRFSIKVEGKGVCELKELTRRVRMGTGGKL